LIEHKHFEIRDTGMRIVSEAQINDKSKDDVFTKFLAVMQISHFLLGIIIRAGQRREAVLLEVGVAGFVGCAVATYLLNLWTPKGVATRTILVEFAGEPPEDVRALITRKPPSN